MVTIGDVVRTIEECYPLSYQESYDNSGLQVGDVTQPLRGIMLAVETTRRYSRSACNVGATYSYRITRSSFEGLSGSRPRPIRSAAWLLL